MKLGIAGAGYWGSKIVDSSGSAKVSTVVMDIRNGDDWHNDTLDAVIIATPADQHYHMTRWYLENGIHVLCEKPTSMDPQQQLELNHLAHSQKLTYQAGHILLFQPNIQYLLDFVSDKNIRHVESRRLNWGRLQTNLDLAWHLAPHDISVIDHLYRCNPVTTIDRFASHLNSSKQYDYAMFDLTYPQQHATITLGWHWPLKVREFVITCDDCQIWLDDEKLQIIEGEYTEESGLVKRKEHVLTFDNEQSPLQLQIQDFIRCINIGDTPRADADHMLRVTTTVTKMSGLLNV
jgi:predicted dehydrogenase